MQCLNRLRRQIYEGGITADLYQEGDIVSRQHTEHCKFPRASIEDFPKFALAIRIDLMFQV